MVLMKIGRKMLGLDAEQYKEYSIDEEFLAKPIYVLIGVKHCAVVTKPIDEITRKGYLHPYSVAMETNVGKGFYSREPWEAMLKTTVTPLTAKGENYS